MEVGDNELRKRYDAMDTDMLIDLLRKGTLTESAAAILTNVLNERGVTADEYARTLNRIQVNEGIYQNRTSPFWVLVNWWASAALLVFGLQSGFIAWMAQIFTPGGMNSSSATHYAGAYAFAYALIFMVGYVSSKWAMSNIDESSFPRSTKNAIKLLLIPGFFALAILPSLIK